MDRLEYHKKYYYDHKHPCLLCGALIAPESKHCRIHAPKPRRVCPITKLHFCKCECGKLIKQGEYAAGHNPKSVRRFTELHFCSCGCGYLVKGKYAAGHNLRVEPPIKNPKNRERMIERLKKLGKLRYKTDPRVNDALTKGRSNELDAARSASMKANFQDPEFKKRWGQSRAKFSLTDRAKVVRAMVSKKMREIKKRDWANPNSVYNTKEYRLKISKGRKRQWQNDEYVLKKMKANGKCPNKQEMRLSYLLRRITPRIFKYNGDARLGLVFGGKTPDFVNVNGKKQVIEFLGNWWHGEERTGRGKNIEEDRLVKHYRKFGFQCLTIWENELDDKDALSKRIKRFVDVH